jgi:hypothetical protein
MPTLYVTMTNFQINPPKVLFIYFPHHVTLCLMSCDVIHIVSHLHDMMLQVVTFLFKKTFLIFFSSHVRHLTLCLK